MLLLLQLMFVVDSPVGVCADGECEFIQDKLTFSSVWCLQFGGGVNYSHPPSRTSKTSDMHKIVCKLMMIIVCNNVK